MNKCELPYPPKELNPNQKNHWSVKHKAFQKYKNDCYFMATEMQPSKKLKITFCPPDRRKRDKDNCISAFKAGQDGIAAAWSIDDVEFDPSYHMGDPVKHGKVLVEAI